MARPSLNPNLRRIREPAAGRHVAALWAWLTEWADVFAEARAYAQLRRRLEDYDDHLLVDVGLRRVGGRIEMLRGGAGERAMGRSTGERKCRTG